jgi:hypothetical protein
MDAKVFDSQMNSDDMISQDSRGLTIDTSQYKLNPSFRMYGLNSYYVKSMNLLRDTHISNDGEFIYEACISAQQILSPDRIPIVYRKRIRNIYEDYRLCCSGLMVYDEEGMITIQILLTNDMIYGYYEKKFGNPDHAAFTSVIPLCKRGVSQSPLDDFVIVGIGIDSYRGIVKFYINREEMYCVPRIGYRLIDQYQVHEYGGISYLVTPKTLRFGFGHFSFLDHHLPNNYSRQYIIESSNEKGYPVYRLASGLAQLYPTDLYREPYPNFNGEHESIDPAISFAYNGDDPNYFIFEQGMITRIRYITGYVAKSVNRSNTSSVDHKSNDDEDSIRDLLNQSRPNSLTSLLNRDNSSTPLYRDKKSKPLSDESKSSLGSLYRRSRQK